MKARVSLALVVCIVGASLIPGIAAADRPEKGEFFPAQQDEVIICDETELTFTEDSVVVTRTHVHELPSGDRFRLIFADAPRDVRVTDGETLYRVRGAGVRGNFTTSDPDADTGDEIGFFRIRLNIIGPDGLFGKVNFLFRVKPNGDEVIRDKGKCQFG
jgi:hypothetical protein